jgi:hypothetical protein
LRVVHLLAWTAGISVALGAFYWLRQIDTAETPTTADRLAEFAFSIAYGSGLCGLGVFGVRWLIGRGGAPSQPGHWILVMLGVAGLIDGGVLLAGAWVKAGSFSSGPAMYSLWFARMTSAWIAAVIAAYIAICGAGGATAAWRRLLLAVAILLSVYTTMLLTVWIAYKTFPVPKIVESTTPLVPIVGIPALLLLLGHAIGSDWRARLPRDWMHYCGLAAATLLACTHLGIALWVQWLAA